MTDGIKTIRDDDGTFPDWATFHDLRHFYASLLIGRGCNVKQVQTVLGHESAVMTLDLYGHWWPDDNDSLRDAAGFREALAATSWSRVISDSPALISYMIVLLERTP